MIGIIKSSLCLLAVATVLLAMVGPHVEAAISCGTVVSALGPCRPYVRGIGPLGGCCNGIKALKSSAKTLADRQTACNCMKSISKSLPTTIAGRAAGLPRQCGVSIANPISPSIDCSKVV